MDLLAFVEQDGRAHLVDARMYGTQQTLMTARSGPEGSGPGTARFGGAQGGLLGAQFSDDGTRFFVGLETGLTVYTVDTMRRRAFGDGSVV